MEALMAMLLGLAAGVIGTGAGGLIGIATTSVSDKRISFLLGFAAGIMLVVVALELVPESLELGGVWLTVAGLILGGLVIAALDFILPHVHLIGEDEHHSLKRTGMVLALGVALHNLPEGLAIGASAAHDISMGVLLAVVLAMHNIPEGMAMAIPLKAARTRPSKIILIIACSGVPMGVGAFLGQVFGSISPGFLSFSMGFAAGAMLFIICDELIPQASKLSEKHSAAYGIMAGVVLGILLIGLAD